MQAAGRAAEHVRSIVSHHAEKNRVTVLNRWMRFLEESAQVIVLRVPDDLNALCASRTTSTIVDCHLKQTCSKTTSSAKLTTA